MRKGFLVFKAFVWMRRTSGDSCRLLRGRLTAKLFRLAVLAVGLALAWPTSGRADFIWFDDHWNFLLIGVPIGPGTTVKPDFGNAMADLANASGSAATITDPSMASSGDVTVSFSRRFQLLNNPNDSDVTLFGTLSGVLTSSSAAAKVFAGAGTIVDATISGTPVIITGAANVIAENDTDNESLLEPRADSAILADGIYTVEGTLEVMVSATQDPVGLAEARAGINWIVGVSAFPVSEPSTFLQLCFGVFVLFVARIAAGRAKARFTQTMKDKAVDRSL